MIIAVLGKHAGAHFICQKLLKDSQVSKIYHFGANVSLQSSGKYIPLIDINTKAGIIDFLDSVKIDLIFLTTIDFLYDKDIQAKIKEKNILSCSPNVENAMLEWSKITGNALLNKLSIPTPNTRILSKNALFSEFFTIPRPWVLKFERDWRAGLQTIIITDDNVQREFDELKQFGQNRLMSSYFGNFENQHFLVQDYIESGREYSYHILSNGVSWKYMGSARDYKKLLENDIGCNTAGMGCYSPVNINPLVHEYADRILTELKNNNNPYIGILYLGIMEDKAGNPYVLEINSRPGDPEIETILACVDENQSLAKLLYQAASGAEIDDIKHNDRHSVCIRIINSEYRNVINSMANHIEIKPHLNPQLWPENPNVTISYGADRKLLNSVINSVADTREEASDKIYRFLENVEMHNFTYRKDIGYLP